MASLYKRGRIWWIKFNLNGEPDAVSTRTENRETAELILQHYKSLEAERYIQASAPQQVSITAWKKEFLEIRKATVAGGTFDKDRNALDSFDYIGSLESLTIAKLQAWFVSDLKRCKSAATANSHLRHIKIWLNMAVTLGYLKSNPANAVKEKREAKSEGQTLSRAEGAALVAHLEKKRPDIAALAKVALATGARSGELCRLQKSQVNLERGVITIESTEEHPTKSRAYRVVPIPQRSEKLLKMLLGQPGKLLLYRHDGIPFDQRYIAREFRRQAEKAGVQCSFHTLRRTYGAWAILDGVDIVTVSKNLGHSSIHVTVEHYAHLLLDDRIRQTQKYNPLTGHDEHADK